MAFQVFGRDFKDVPEDFRGNTEVFQRISRAGAFQGFPRVSRGVTGDFRVFQVHYKRFQGCIIGGVARGFRSVKSFQEVKEVFGRFLGALQDCSQRYRRRSRGFQGFYRVVLREFSDFQGHSSGFQRV